MGIRTVVASALIAAAGACTAPPPPPSPRPSPAPPPAVEVVVDRNPPVAPGLVRWHPDFEAACAAARASGKPVLLFDMLGRLDREHC
jgi:hypothetical protein